MLRWPLRSVHSGRVFAGLRRASTKPPPPLPESTLLREKAPKPADQLPREDAPRSDTQEQTVSPGPVRSSPPYGSIARFVVYTWMLLTSGHIFVTHFYECDTAYGISMLPTIASYGDWVVISKYYRRGREIKVGDVISFRHPTKPGERAVKRVLATEGDFVLANTPEKSDAMIQVPQGHCWVVGDNLQHSRDSRMFGPLPLALVSGKIIATIAGAMYWPNITRMEGIKSADVADEID